jgi:hypothetical protein
MLTVTIGSFLIAVKIINMINTICPSPKSTVFKSRYLKGFQRLSFKFLFFVVFDASGVNNKTHTSASIVINKNGETSGSIRFKSFINPKLDAKHIVAHNIFIAAKRGLASVAISPSLLLKYEPIETSSLLLSLFDAVLYRPLY